MDVVVEGVVEGEVLHGHKIITRCASKYEPKDGIAASGASLAEM
jgi:cytochrome c-type biogenesis protein CcmE